MALVDGERDQRDATSAGAGWSEKMLVDGRTCPGMMVMVMMMITQAHDAVCNSATRKLITTVNHHANMHANSR